MIPEDLDLDRWLAEKCMGWKLDRDWWLDSDHSALTVYLVPDEDNQSSSLNQEDWHPTDPKTGQIWLCVEKMRERGWFLELKDFGGSPDGWRALWSRFSLEKPNFVYAFDDDPAQAICKAIYAALSNEKEELK